MTSIKRACRLVCCLALILMSGAAIAGVPVSLPPDEDVEHWKAPLELAGLEIALRGSTSEVRIEASDTQWRIVVDGPPDRVTLVGRPTNAAERQELAFLARALARSLSALKEPPGRLPPPGRLTVPSPSSVEPVARPEPDAAIPAPSPQSPSEPVVEAVIAPEAAPEIALAGTEAAAADDLAVLGDPVAVGSPPGEALAIESSLAEASSVEASPGEASPGEAPPGEAVALGLEADQPERRRRRINAAVPPLSLAFALLGRARTGAAVSTLVGLEVFEQERVALRLDVGFCSSRRLADVEDDLLFRRLWSLESKLAVLYQPQRWWNLEASLGGSYRGYRQQGNPIADVLTPVGGVAGELLTAGRLRVGVRMSATVDFAKTVIVNHQGEAFDLNPVEIGLGLVMKTSGFGDPNAVDATSRW